MQHPLSRRLFLLALPLLAASAGCGLVADWQLNRAKTEARTKFAQVLEIALKGRMIELPAAEAATDDAMACSEVAINGMVVRLPKYDAVKSPLRQGTIVLDYPRFKVMVQSFDDEVDLPPEWGPSNFARYRAIYGLNDARVAAVVTPDEMAHVTNGIAMKSMLLVIGSDKRFTEFRSPTLHGFVIGSFDAGSQSVFFETYAEGNDDRRTMIAFMPRDDLKPGATKPTDAEFERFMATVEIHPDEA